MPGKDPDPALIGLPDPEFRITDLQARIRDPGIRLGKKYLRNTAK
jgi:hypothetical protein